MGRFDFDGDLKEARAKCFEIATHVLSLTSASDKVLAGPLGVSQGDTLRPAYVLTLLAVEETGKLFKIWQEASVAETNHQNRVVASFVFRSHELKGGTAGDLCCQMLDFALKALKNQPSMSGSNIVLIGQIEAAKNHLLTVYPHFITEREEAMYIGRSADDWSLRHSALGGTIEWENLLLSVVGSTATTYLRTPGTFSLATKALTDLQIGNLSSTESVTFLTYVSASYIASLFGFLP